MSLRTRQFAPSIRRLVRGLPCLAVAGLVLSSCSSADVRERTERTDQAFYKLGTNADIRQDARDKRYDAAWDWIMD